MYKTPGIDEISTPGVIKRSRKAIGMSNYLTCGENPLCDVGESIQGFLHLRKSAVPLEDVEELCNCTSFRLD